MSTLFERIKEKNIPYGNHETDLYFKDTVESRFILSAFPLNESNARRFTVQSGHTNAGETWWDVPFAYDPAWDNKK